MWEQDSQVANDERMARELQAQEDHAVVVGAKSALLGRDWLLCEGSSC